MPEDTEALRRRKRHTKSKLAPERGGLIGLVRRPWFGFALFGAMMLVALIHVWSAWRETASAAGRFGPLALGMSGADIRGILGQPDQSSSTASAWRFNRAGRDLIVRFDPGTATATGFSCREAGPDSLACPSVLGVHQRTGVQEVLQRLGPGRHPGTATASEQDYPELGLRIELHDGQVSAIHIDATSRGASIWPIVLWRLVP
jgi:hypothetical protein